MKRATLTTALILASTLAGAFVQHYCDALLVANILHSSSMSISENVEQAAALLDLVENGE